MEQTPRPSNWYTLVIDGGIGDHICVTPMLRATKKAYPDHHIIVSACYWDVLDGNPNIDKLFHISAEDAREFYEDWVIPQKDPKKTIRADLYTRRWNHVYDGLQSKAWSEICGLPWDNDELEVFLRPSELIWGMEFIKNFGEKVVLINSAAANIPLTGKKGTPNKDWFHDRWVALVKRLREAGVSVLQIGGNGETCIPGVNANLCGGLSIRQTLSILTFCSSYVTVESFIGHAGPAVGKPGVVLFGRSNPHISGHAMNTNLWIPGSCDNLFCCRPEGYYLDGFNCPSRPCMSSITVSAVFDALAPLIPL